MLIVTRILWVAASFILQASAIGLFDDLLPSLVYNVTIGEPIRPDEQVEPIGATMSVTLIPAYLKVSGAGVVHRVEVHVGEIKDGMSHGYLQAWRPVGENIYSLVYSQQLNNTRAGRLSVELAWNLLPGDYLGISCNGFCPFMKLPFYKGYRSYVSLDGNTNRQYIDGMIVSFENPPFESRIALQAVMEVNKVLMTTPYPNGGIVDRTVMRNASSTKSSNGLGDNEETTSVRAPATPVVASQSPSVSETGVVWIVVFLAVLVFITAVYAVVAGVCYSRRRRRLERELLQARTEAASQSNTMQRNQQLSFSNEITVNEGAHSGPDNRTIITLPA